MRTIGFSISSMENERRRAILPCDVRRLRHPELVYVETGYGNVLGISDDEYTGAGCNTAPHDEVITKEIVCDPKIGEADYLDTMPGSQIIFGWIHATQNRGITDRIINKKLTAYGWEKMFDKGRHVFWQNNELAGEAAVLHAFQCFGQLPHGLSAAVIGNGNTAHGAVRALTMLGARVTQYNRRTEALLRAEIGSYDAVINCVLWDVMRKDHIISKDDLGRMKKNSMIIDVSCDCSGAIETSVPTSIENPTYLVDGILHYAVNHTPSLYHKTFTYNNSAIIVPYIDELMAGDTGDVLNKALLIDHGVIMDKLIKDYQGR